MNPNEVYVRRDGSGPAIRIVGIDEGSGGAVLITEADTFGPVFGVAASGISRHYTLKHAAPAPGKWATPFEEVV